MQAAQPPSSPPVANAQNNPRRKRKARNRTAAMNYPTPAANPPEAASSAGPQSNNVNTPAGSGNRNGRQGNGQRAGSTAIEGLRMAMSATFGAAGSASGSGVGQGSQGRGTSAVDESASNQVPEASGLRPRRGLSGAAAGGQYSQGDNLPSATSTLSQASLLALAQREPTESIDDAMGAPEESAQDPAQLPAECSSGAKKKNKDKNGNNHKRQKTTHGGDDQSRKRRMVLPTPTPSDESSSDAQDEVAGGSNDQAGAGNGRVTAKAPRRIANGSAAETVNTSKYFGSGIDKGKGKEKQVVKAGRTGSSSSSGSASRPAVGQEAGQSEQNGSSSKADGIQQQMKERAKAMKDKEEIERMTKELDGYKKQVAFKDSELRAHDATMEHIKQSVTCNVCLEIFTDPHVLNPCGHTSCAACLLSWFRSTNSLVRPMAMPDDPDERLDFMRTRTKACFTCRTAVAGKPMPSFIINDILHTIKPQLSALDGAIGVEPEVAAAGPPVDRNKMWDEVFEDGRGDRGNWYVDEADGVRRCRGCGSELEGMECIECNRVYSDVDPSDSDSDDSLGVWDPDIGMYRRRDDEDDLDGVMRFHSDDEQDDRQGANDILDIHRRALGIRRRGSRSPPLPFGYLAHRYGHYSGEDSDSANDMDGFIVPDDESVGEPPRRHYSPHFDYGALSESEGSVDERRNPPPRARPYRRPVGRYASDHEDEDMSGRESDAGGHAEPRRRRYGDRRPQYSPPISIPGSDDDDRSLSPPRRRRTVRDSLSPPLRRRLSANNRRRSPSPPPRARYARRSPSPRPRARGGRNPIVLSDSESDHNDYNIAPRNDGRLQPGDRGGRLRPQEGGGGGFRSRYFPSRSPSPIAGPSRGRRRAAQNVESDHEDSFDEEGNGSGSVRGGEMGDYERGYYLSDAEGHDDGDRRGTESEMEEELDDGRGAYGDYSDEDY